MARLLIGLSLAALLAGRPGVPAPASGAAYDQFYANFAGEELMRAINADRAAVGRPALAADATLEALARDRPVTCPSDAALIIHGRARDMADRGYLSHTIPGCTTAGRAFGAFDLLTAAGYVNAFPAENIAENDYPATVTQYALGCNASGTGCSGSTGLPWTVAIAERGFMSSQTHRDNLLSTTSSRFGCAAWRSSGGTNYYACYFVGSGNGVLDALAPAVGQLVGAGAEFAPGSTPTFTAEASDGASVLADAWAAIDGIHIRNWAWDHAGASARLSATASPVASGQHTFTWWIRDASTRSRAVSFEFTVSGSPPASASPAPTATATRTRSPSSSLPVTATPRATPGPDTSPRSSATGSGSTAGPSSTATVGTEPASAETSTGRPLSAGPGVLPDAGASGEQGASSSSPVLLAIVLATAGAALLVSGGRRRVAGGTGLRGWLRSGLRGLRRPRR